MPESEQNCPACNSGKDISQSNVRNVFYVINKDSRLPCTTNTQRTQRYDLTWYIAISRFITLLQFASKELHNQFMASTFYLANKGFQIFPTVLSMCILSFLRDSM